MDCNVSQTRRGASICSCALVAFLGMSWAPDNKCQEWSRQEPDGRAVYPDDVQELLDALPPRNFEFVFAAPGDPRLSRQISRALSVAPKTERVVKPGETLSKIIVDSFGVAGGSISPSSPDFRPNIANDEKAYELLKQEIVELNALASADQIHASQKLVIPDLPRMLGTTSDVFAEEHDSGTSRTEIDYSAVSRSNRYVTFEDRRPSLTLRLKKAAFANLFPKFSKPGEEAPFTASTVIGTFGGHCQGWQASAALPTTVSPEDQKVLQKAADDAKKIGKPVTMFVIDSGWPNEQARNASIEWFNAATDVAWNKYLGNYPKPDWAKVAVPASFVEPTNCHVRLVSRAIDSVQSVLGSQPSPVTVVYIPLSADQESASFLKALVGVGRALSVASAYENGLPLEGTSQERAARVKGWSNEADKIVKLVQATIDPQKERFQMEEWIPVATIFLGRAIASANARPYLINESFWIATKEHPLLQVPSGGLGGLIVAAAGQEGGRAMSALKPLYAYQAIAKNIDTVAVMNLDANGEKNCASNYIDDKYRDKAIVVGYSGDVDAGIPAPAVPCSNSGTSFSSPRVAWMLALMESARDDYEAELFPKDVAAAILTSHQQPVLAHPKFSDIRFSASLYWQARSKGGSN